MSDGVETTQCCEIELSQDGTAVIVTTQVPGQAKLTKYAIPYTNALWLAKAILSVGRQAVQKQSARGAIEGIPIVGDMLEAETLQLLVKPREDRAALVAFGKWTSSNAPGTTTLLVHSSAAPALIDELREFVQMAQALSRPS
jgi:hypothetical protein